MFTGIVEATAEILENSGTSLTVARPAMFDDVKIGASISVAGVCLTVVGLDDQSMRFDVVEETRMKTTLPLKKKGDRVNLERAVTAGGRLDGHVVQGHIEGMGEIISDLRKADSGLLKIALPNNLIKFVVQKGSIAIDGVSLTVAAVEGNVVSIALIPHTKKITTLGQLKPGDRVNIETDVLARHHRAR